MRITKRFVLLALVFPSLLFVSCDAINPKDGDLVDFSCEGCHTNAAALTRIISSLDLEVEAEESAAPG
ncbi:MAG: hypothetical protein K9N35_10435 [Candidatus Marinimicrobia bacterium]|nr:hypothetical protein [Candidatus Neomarinimicrobiota bacterium]